MKITVGAVVRMVKNGSVASRPVATRPVIKLSLH